MVLSIWSPALLVPTKTTIDLLLILFVNGLKYRVTASLAPTKTTADLLILFDNGLKYRVTYFIHADKDNS